MARRILQRDVFVLRAPADRLSQVFRTDPALALFLRAVQKCGKLEPGVWDLTHEETMLLQVLNTSLVRAGRVGAQWLNLLRFVALLGLVSVAAATACAAAGSTRPPPPKPYTTGMASFSRALWLNVLAFQSIQHELPPESALATRLFAAAGLVGPPCRQTWHVGSGHYKQAGLVRHRMRHPG